MSPFLYFWFFGLFNLFLMLRTDLKELHIDDRHNWYMTGIVGSIVALIGRDIRFVFLLVILAVVLRHLTKNLYAEGDRNILAWSFVGIGLLGTSYLYIYLVSLIIITIAQAALKRLYSLEGEVAGLPIFFSAFMYTGVVYALTT